MNPRDCNNQTISLFMETLVGIHSTYLRCKSAFNRLTLVDPLKTFLRQLLSKSTSPRCVVFTKMSHA